MGVVKHEIKIGALDAPLFEYDNESIKEQNISQAAGLIGQELSIDNITMTIRAKYEETHDIEMYVPKDAEGIVTADGSYLATGDSKGPHISELVNVPYGTPLYYYSNDALVGKFYTTPVERISKEDYKLYGISAIGLLDKMESGGGLLNCTFAEAVAIVLSTDINGNSGGQTVIDYMVTPDVAVTRVYGWLPHDTKRNNLYRIMFATGVNIIRGNDGNPIFTFIYPTSPKDIAKTKIYDAGSVTYNKPASSISIVEHAYSVAGTEQEETIFDNSTVGTAVKQQIWFSDAPIIPNTVRATGNLTFEQLTVNGAVVTGNGMLIGKPYTHSTQTVTRTNEANAETANIITVQNATMVNYLNSENLLNRLFAYYCGVDGKGTQTIKNELIANEDENDTELICGANYTLLNPFEEDVEAYMQSIDLSTSTFGKASCEMIANYVPAGSEGLYEHYLILDKDTFEKDGGVFNVAERCPGAREILVIMIGGGQGGQAGWPGKNGQDASVYTWVTGDFDLAVYSAGAEGGDGGDGGKGGHPGKVLYQTISNPSPTYNYTIGHGGAGAPETGFIPDTASELRAALQNENPGRQYSAQEMQALIDQQRTHTDWTGQPPQGAEGTETTFWHYTSDDGSVQPYVYHPILKETFAKAGENGIKGGKGGAIRETDLSGEYTWIRNGQDVSYKGTKYAGGAIGNPKNSLVSLPEAKFIAYGGNGAGAAVGLSADDHPEMNGGNAPEASYTVKED